LTARQKESLKFPGIPLYGFVVGERLLVEAVWWELYEILLFNTSFCPMYTVYVTLSLCCSLPIVSNDHVTQS